jgi:transposase-like protein
MVTEGGLSVLEVSSRLSLPKSTLERWRRVSKRGDLGKIGKGQRPLTEIESELAKVKRELSLAKMERDILKNGPKGIHLSL